MKLLGDEVPCVIEVTNDEIKSAFQYFLEKNNKDVQKIEIDNGLNSELRGYGLDEHEEYVPFFKGIKVTVKNNYKQKTISE